MSFREKSDWLSFVSLCIFSIYFGQLGWGIVNGTRPEHPHYFFYLFWVLVVALIAIQVLTHIVLAIRSPKDAQTPVDERERLIHLRANRPAYYVLLVGAFMSILVMHLGFTVIQFAHTVLFVIWIAELLRYGMRLYYYRREA